MLHSEYQCGHLALSSCLKKPAVVVYSGWLSFISSVPGLHCKYRIWPSRGSALVQHALGNTEATNAALKKLIDCCAQGGAFQIAQIYALRGEIDLAFEWLNKVYDNRDSAMAYVFIWPGFDNLHEDPRWKPLLDKMGLPL